MSISGFLEGQASAGRLPSLGPMSTVSETTGAAFDFVRSNINIEASLRLSNKAFTARDQALRDATGKDPFQISGARDKYPSRDPDAIETMLNYHQSALDAFIMKGRQDDPAKFNGIKTKAETEQAARDEANNDRKTYDETMARASGPVRFFGGLAGSIAGGFTDPLNLATLPFGAGAGRTILQSAMIEGALNAAVETVSTPAIAKWQKELGQKYGLGDAAEDIGTAFLGGAGLATIIRGAAPAFRKLSEVVGSGSQRVLDLVAANEKMPPSVRDAATYMSRVAHIDENAPPGMLKTEEDLVVHHEKVQETANDLENYREPTALNSEELPTREAVHGEEGNQVNTLEIKTKTPEQATKEITPSTNEQAGDGDAYFNTDKLTAAKNQPDASREKLVYLTPEEFLSMAERDGGPNPKKTETVQGVLQRGERFKDIPFLGFENNGDGTAKVIAHEGRHRARALQEAGVSKMPVILKSIEGGPGQAIRWGQFNGELPLTLKGQGRGEEISFPVEKTPSAERVADEAKASGKSTSDLDSPQNVPPLVKTPKEIKQADRLASKRATFEQAMKENPDLKITMEDGSELTMKQLLEKTKEDFNVIEALTTCRLE